METGFEYPEYDGEGEEDLSFPNIWRDTPDMELTGVDCFNPTAIVNNDENLVVLRLTGQEFTQMFSALYLGAEIAYPQSFFQVIVNFLKGIHCPPLMAEQECFEYPAYASFIQYAPTNPFIEPDTIPDGYLLPPFYIQDTDDDGLLINDVIVPFGAFELLAGWFDLLDGLVPQITIMVNGAGHADIRLLTMPFGGLCVITLDSPPNLIDIIVGIVTGADNIVDLNLDEVSVPPETAREIIFPMDIAGSGIHTIYIDFLPIMDDSFIPLRFGGGFRGVQLCNFIEEVVDLSVTDIRIQDCEIQYFKNGEWVGLVSGSLDACYATNLELEAVSDELEALTLTVFGHDEAISDLLAWKDDTDLAIAALNDNFENAFLEIFALQDRMDLAEAELADHEARILALEMISYFNWDWTQEFDFTTGSLGWTVPVSGRGDYIADEGFLSEADAVNSAVDLTNADEPYTNQIFFVSMDISYNGVTAPSDLIIKWKYGENPSFEQAKIAGFDIDSSPDRTGWFRNLNEDSVSMTGIRALSNSPTRQFYIRGLKFYGMGANPFA
jgi:hypothetical protein